MTTLLPIIRTWSEWGRMFTDAAQWSPAVREICRREGIPAECIEAGYPGTNAVFVVDRAYVVKIYAPFCHDEFDLERKLHTLLARNPRLPVPRFIAEGVLEDRMSWPYLVLNFKPGEPIREVRERLSRDDLLQVSAQLGDIVRELHRTPVAQFKTPEVARTEWRQFIEERRSAACTAAHWTGVLPDVVVEEIPGFLASVLPEDDTTSLVLLNGDLTEDHVLLRRQNGQWRVSGLIDFGDALVGRREYEWVALWFGALDRDYDGLAVFIERYDSGVQLDDGFFRRAMAFALLHEFGTGILADVLQALGQPRVMSIQELQSLLWA